MWYIVYIYWYIEKCMWEYFNEYIKWFRREKIKLNNNNNKISEDKMENYMNFIIFMYFMLLLLIRIC